MIGAEPQELCCMDRESITRLIRSHLRYSVSQTLGYIEHDYATIGFMHEFRSDIASALRAIASEIEIGG